jgi:hypothetical protein
LITLWLLVAALVAYIKLVAQVDSVQDQACLSQQEPHTQLQLAVVALALEAKTLPAIQTQITVQIQYLARLHLLEAGVLAIMISQEKMGVQAVLAVGA